MGLWGSFRNSEGNITRRKKKKKKKKQNMCLAINPNGEVALMLVSTTSKQELNMEALAELLRVRTRPECPEDNLRELT